MKIGGYTPAYASSRHNTQPLIQKENPIQPRFGMATTLNGIVYTSPDLSRELQTLLDKAVVLDVEDADIVDELQRKAKNSKTPMEVVIIPIQREKLQRLVDGRLGGIAGILGIRMPEEVRLQIPEGAKSTARLLGQLPVTKHLVFTLTGWHLTEYKKALEEHLEQQRRYDASIRKHSKHPRDAKILEDLAKAQKREQEEFNDTVLKICRSHHIP